MHPFLRQFRAHHASRIFVPRAEPCRLRRYYGQNHDQRDGIIAPTPLPSNFFSLYRLFLRSTAASVLSERAATASLRRLWRPAFTQAAAVIQELQSDTIPSARRHTLTDWLTRWESRMDETLSLLYSSAVARGLSHQVIRNLNLLVTKNEWFFNPNPAQVGGVWDGQLPPDHRLYHTARGKKVKSGPQQERDRLSERSTQILGDLIGMAEGAGGLSLGRVHRRR